MKLTKTALAFGLLMMVSMTLRLHAQSGCADSPENPTIVLALVGGMGALASRLRRSRRR